MSTDTRTLLDRVIRDFPCTALRISSNDFLINSPHLKSAICKVQNRKEGNHRDGSCQYFSFGSTEPASQAKIKSLTYTQITVKNQKMSVTESFRNPQILEPTSNINEQFFYIAGPPWDDNRRNVYLQIQRYNRFCTRIIYMRIFKTSIMF